MAALDAVGIAALASVIKGGLRRGAGGLAGAATVALTKKQIGDLGEEMAIRMLADSGYVDILPIKNASNNGLDIVARAPDGHFTVFEVKSSAGKLASQSIPRSQKQMDRVLARMLDDAADGVGKYKSIDPIQRQQAMALRQAYLANPRSVSGAAIGVDVSVGNIYIQRWARSFD